MTRPLTARQVDLPHAEQEAKNVLFALLYCGTLQPFNENTWSEYDFSSLLVLCVSELTITFCIFEAHSITEL